MRCVKPLSLVPKPFNLSILCLSCAIWHNVQLSISMTLEKPGAESTGPEIKRVSAYGDDETILHSNGTTKLHSSSIDSTAQEPKSNPPKNAAKIHDFCLGIPFGELISCSKLLSQTIFCVHFSNIIVSSSGGIIFGVGLVGFILSKNPTALLFGGGILALSTLSLKIWSQGKSSLPFILGQIGNFPY